MYARVGNTTWRELERPQRKMQRDYKKEVWRGSKERHRQITRRIRESAEIEIAILQREKQRDCTYSKETQPVHCYIPDDLVHTPATAIGTAL